MTGATKYRIKRWLIILAAFIIVVALSIFSVIIVVRNEQKLEEQLEMERQEQLIESSEPADEIESSATGTGATGNDNSESGKTETGISETETSEEVIVEEPEPPHVTLAMVGDVLMHLKVTDSGLMEDGTYNYDHMFANVKDEIEAADLAIVNQEVILGGKDLGFSGYPMFNTAFEVGDAEAAAGFDVVLHATNHTMDKGRQGLLNDMDFWKNNHPEIAVLGINETEEAQDDIFVYEKDGIRIAILNYTYGLNGMPMPSDMPFAVNLMDENLMDRNIAKAHEVADFVVVTVHWGNEYQTVESENQHMWCEFFLERDVDLVIGAHPHVIQPVEMWVDEEDGDEMLVYYSLGNFINSTADTGTGVGKRVVGGMAQITISADEEGEPFIEEYGVLPLVTQIEYGPGKIATYKLEDYTDEMAAASRMSARDPSFNLEMCKNLCREVWGDLYKE